MKLTRLKRKTRQMSNASANNQSRAGGHGQPVAAHEHQTCTSTPNNSESAETFPVKDVGLASSCRQPRREQICYQSAVGTAS